MVAKVPHGVSLRAPRAFLLLGSGVLLTALASCSLSPPPPTTPESALIAEGRQIFFNETFEGNGRTCGTCHRAEDNFGLTPAFIATLPPNDPLFVAEFNPLLGDLERPRLLREFGLILENQDGFDDLENNFNLRGVPHTLGMRFSIDSDLGPQTGWSGDGSPGDRSLRAFATGAVIQHFPKRLSRVFGTDFRLPTDNELDALEAFQLSLGRQDELVLPLPLKGTVAKRGQEIFNNLGPAAGGEENGAGKCSACHFNAGANVHPVVAAALGVSGNLNFNTGVEDLPDQPQDLTGEFVPPDDGFGTPGQGEFNTPSLIESADTGPFFHNNSIETIEGAVAFYNGDTFNNSPAGQLVIGATGSGINLDGTQVVEVAAFLRVINALENIRETIALLEQSQTEGHGKARDTLGLALAETEDAIAVLAGGGLHPEAVLNLREAERLAEGAKHWFYIFFRDRKTEQAIGELEKAREVLIAPSSS